MTQQKISPLQVDQVLFLRLTGAPLTATEETARLALPLPDDAHTIRGLLRWTAGIGGLGGGAVLRANDTPGNEIGLDYTDTPGGVEWTILDIQSPNPQVVVVCSSLTRDSMISATLSGPIRTLTAVADLAVVEGEGTPGSDFWPAGTRFDGWYMI